MRKKTRNNTKAQSVIEYAMLIAVVMAALVGMQIYMKRAVSQRWQQSADTFGYGRIWGP